MNDSFFSDEDKASIKKSFIASLKAGVSAAAFIAPVVFVFAIGSAFTNLFSNSK